MTNRMAGFDQQFAGTQALIAVETNKQAVCLTDDRELTAQQETYVSAHSLSVRRGPCHFCLRVANFICFEAIYWSLTSHTTAELFFFPLEEG